MTFQAGWLSAASIIPSDPAAGLEIILSHAEGDNIFPSGLLKDELLDPTNFTESFLDPSVSTNEFIIRRFCSTYPIENWALDII
ncbi:hypothetical protein SISSUDRAFT_423238 [Sistotremastrum suecicum HHB10207 ss-3]|uniref:Uncharacterized protein n=1 Tax=Sistotremastrum suecicum HHB10207 ss-3 TaxID=1314776 RepID=A0A165YK19_9AGAM|nr:hypothetical protein SISSUDRAFT_423238 [Sistotremastrum suecicum HHB10207 ss-3]